MASLDLRLYQQLILDQAMEGNVIACLPTGAGKTLIACHVIGSRVLQIRSSRDDDEWKRVVVFIAPTRLLLDQQVAYIEKHCPQQIKALVLNGKSICNGKIIDRWTLVEWRQQFRAYELLGMTPEVFRALLDKFTLPAHAVDAVIIDECHHAQGNHPMGLMVDALLRSQPGAFLFSMTASPINTKKAKASDLANLQQRLCSSFVSVSTAFLESLMAVHSSPHVWITGYTTNTAAQDLSTLSNHIRNAINLETLYCYAESTETPDWDMLWEDCGSTAPSFENVWMPEYLETTVRQVAQAAIALGPFSGLQTLLEALTSGAWRDAATPLGRLRQLHAVDKTVFDGMASQIAASAFPSDPIQYRKLLRNQPRVLVWVLCSLVLRLLELSCSTEVLTELLEGAAVTGEQASVIKHMNMLWGKQACHVFPQELLGVPLSDVICSLLLIVSEAIALLLPDVATELTTFKAGNAVSCKVLSSFRLLAHYLSDSSQLKGHSSELFASIPRTKCLMKSAKASDEPRTAPVIVVFCKMRVVASTLHRIASLSGCRQLRSALLTGDSTKSEQQRVMHDLRRGSTNVLFATDVVEEGVDLPECDLVIHFDKVENTKSFIQRKGRARKQGAHSVHLIACATHDDSFEQYLYSESESESMNGLDGVQELVSFLNEEVNCWNHFVNCLQGQGALECRSGGQPFYEVKGIGARILGAPAVGLLYECCRSHFPLRAAPQWVYRRRIEGSTVAFQCDLVMPVFAEAEADGKTMELRTFLSAEHHTKVAAKYDAALCAVQYLHETGMLDDHLRLPIAAVSENSSSSFEVGGKDEDEVVNHVIVQVVPTVFRFNDESEAVTAVYVYAPLLVSVSEGLAFSTADGDVIQSLAFALLQPMPDSALEVHYPVLVSGHHVLIRWAAVGERFWTVDKQTLDLMRRFHEALACLHPPDAVAPFGYLPFPPPVPVSPAKAVAMPRWGEWSRASNGAWYLVMPRPQLHLTELVSNEGLSWLEKCALEAETLVHNLRVVEATVHTGIPFNPHPISGSEEDLVITSNGQNLFHWRSSMARGPALTDVMPGSTVTFADHYRTRCPELIDTLSADPTYRLVCVHPVTPRLTWTNIVVSSATVGDKKSPEFNHVIPEACRALGRMCHLRAAMLLPALAHELIAVVRASECRAWLEARIPAPLSRLCLPPAQLLLQAMTPKLMVENLHSERLEYYGDTVLKYVSSVAMYCLHPVADQGLLTSARSKLISNKTLANSAKDSGLLLFLRATPAARGLEEVLLCAPGQVASRSLRNHHLQSKRGQPKPPAHNSEVPWGCALVALKGKTVADLVEAVLGAMYMHCQDDEAVVALLQALDLLPITFSMRQHAQAAVSVPATSAPLATEELNLIQGALGYAFQCPALAALAVTHPSWSLVASYERLEFLGDAVLDMCVVNHLILDNARYPDEGALTEEKSARTNNRVLGVLGRRLKLERLLRHKVVGLVPDTTEANPASNFRDREDVKVFADVVEALVGAVYLDSGMSLPTAAAAARRLGIVC